MPKFFLHVCNGVPLRDENGSEFPDLAAARVAAVRGISELIAESIIEGHTISLSHRIVIEDDRNLTVETIKFGEFFEP